MALRSRVAFLAFLSVCFGADTEKRSNGLADLIDDKQLYLSKKSRFIKFDTKENEVEIELGISIPVVKIPLEPRLNEESGGLEPGISVSAPGLVVAGVLMLTTFLFVPLLFSPKIHNLRSDEREEKWNVLERIQNGFHNSLVRSPGCLENVICRTAKAAVHGREGTVWKWMDNVLRSQWMGRLLNGTFVERAIATGRSGSDCSRTYRDCSMVKR